MATNRLTDNAQLSGIYVLPRPESQLIDLPHGHHRWTVSLADGVTLTEVEQTVPGKRLGILVDEVRLLARREFR